MTDLVYLMLFVAAGSAVGGLARFIVSGLVARAVGETFPWGTMTVNVTGAFGIGIVSVLAESLFYLDRPEAWPLLVTGILGSYTTVSSFSLQTLALARDGQMFRAIGNVLLSLLLCLGGVAAGMAAASQLALWTLP
ncbi:MAG: fluoride efflux transporter CrcB [Paracoccaceae bacterium]